MTFNPDDPAPPNREYPVQDERMGNGGAFGIIVMMAVVAIAGFYWLQSRPAIRRNNGFSTIFCFATIPATRTGT